MDQGQAYALVVFGVVASTALALTISSVIRKHVLRRTTFALIREDLAGIRNRHAHLPSAPSGELSPSTPDGPKPAAPARQTPSTGREQRVVGLTPPSIIVSPTTSKAA